MINIEQNDNRKIIIEEPTGDGCLTARLSWPRYLGVNVDSMSKPTVQKQPLGLIFITIIIIVIIIIIIIIVY